MMKYKHYLAQVEFDDEAELFHGEVINTKDVITFQGRTVSELKQAFHDSVDDYLAFCQQRGESPDKPFSGRFNVRVEPDIHRDAMIAAKSSDKSLNHWVRDALKQYLKRQ